MTASQASPALSNNRFIDWLFGWAALAAAGLTLLLLIGILLSLVIGAWPAIEAYGLGFLGRTVWDPVKNDYGGLVMIYGTLATSLIALTSAAATD